MKLYESKNWEVVFVKWCQEFPGDCIISSKNVNVNMELDKNVNLEIGQFVPILFH